MSASGSEQIVFSAAPASSHRRVSPALSLACGTGPPQDPTSLCERVEKIGLADTTSWDIQNIDCAQRQRRTQAMRQAWQILAGSAIAPSWAAPMQAGLLNSLLHEPY